MVLGYIIPFLSPLIEKPLKLGALPLVFYNITQGDIFESEPKLRRKLEPLLLLIFVSLTVKLGEMPWHKAAQILSSRTS